jgi:ArsR family transcriptional regulator
MSKIGAGVKRAPRAKRQLEISAQDAPRQEADAEQRWAEEVARMGWALAHPARVRILRLLLQRGRCVCGEVVDRLPLAQSTVSQHLKILKAAGLVISKVEGPRVSYDIHPEHFLKLKQLVAEL